MLRILYLIIPYLLNYPKFYSNMTQFPSRDHLKEGMYVLIETKPEQGTGNLTEGIIKKILTSSKTHPHGIKVELEDGQVGRVKEVSDKEAIISLEPQKTSISIRPSEDLSNRIKIIKLLSNAVDYIWISNWAFQKQHFGIFDEVLEQNINLSEIRLLCKLDADIKKLEGLKEYYKLMKNQYSEIKIELKVITNRKLGKEMHDRFYYTKGQAWNFIELDSVLRNTRADINLLPEDELEKNMKKDFLKYWDDSETFSITNGWEKIKELSKVYAENIQKNREKS